MANQNNEKYFKIITDADFGDVPKPLNDPKMRLGARGIILNDQAKIAILHMDNVGAYKLVGGGIEEGENPEETFKREVLEEAGCEVEIDSFLGVIREEKSQDNFAQDSYVFVGHVISDTGELHLTEKEISRGSELVWLTPEDALKKIEENLNDSNIAGPAPELYQLKFIPKRDAEILKYYLELIKN